MQARIAVLASGEGSNLQALLADPLVGPRVMLVVSDRAGAGALERARTRGVTSEFVDPSGAFDREDYDRSLRKRLDAAEIEFVLCAGFMRVLSSEMVHPFEGHMLNVHPSLLPAFPGANAPRDALAWGVKVTGVTVHFVEAELDQGPIVAQESVPIEPGDDVESLHARIRSVEHRLYPWAARALIEGRITLEGRTVHISPEQEARP
ncbi:MAG: phosphoribosylglycinamide formyltransferase [Actinomycetota bacterium]|nr:phosphoribosylglycinamide formyltransferase [Actinomycetota bacterium]